MPFAEMMTLVPEFEARIFWLLLLRLLERLRNILAAGCKDGHESIAQEDDFENLLREVNHAVNGV